MIAVEGAAESNTDPPSLALVAHTVMWLGLVLAVRRPAERRLERPRVWAPIALGGSAIMTVFLWHMTALVLVAALTHPTGWWPEAEQLDGTWWALRPLWLASCTMVLAGLVARSVASRRCPTRSPTSGVCARSSASPRPSWASASC